MRPPHKGQSRSGASPKRTQGDQPGPGSARHLLVYPRASGRDFPIGIRVEGQGLWSEWDPPALLVGVNDDETASWEKSGPILTVSDPPACPPPPYTLRGK